MIELEQRVGRFKEKMQRDGQSDGDKKRRKKKQGDAKAGNAA